MVQLVGQTIGRYHVVEQLGEGGMAQVYKAYDNRLERYVAVKVILPSQSQDETFLKRFEREAKSLAQFSHPNIVRVLDYGDQNGMPYLIMEFVSGGTLKQKLGSPMPFPEAARILAPIARALDAAHHRGIYHRDVKPANILLNESGQPLLSDFGIAKVLETGGDGSTLTGAGVGIGTPEYMSPEQGMGSAIDQRTDVYSLGVVFYELVTGRKPYRADTPMAVVYKQITEPLPRPREFMPTLPDDVERIIFKAMAKKPEDRYQDMRAFADALEALAARQIAASSEATVVSRPSEATLLSPAPVGPTVVSQAQSGPTVVSPAQPGAVHPAPAQPAPTAPKKSSMLWVILGVVGVGGLAVLIAAGVLISRLISPPKTPPAAASGQPTLAAGQSTEKAPVAVGSTPAPAQTSAGPTATQPAVETPVNLDPNALSIQNIEAGLEKLDSYKLTFTSQVSGKDASGAQVQRKDNYSRLAVNTTKNTHIHFVGDGDDIQDWRLPLAEFDLYMAEGSLYSYTLASDVCSSISGTDMTVLDAMVASPGELIGAITNAQLADTGASMNGVTTRHYVLDQTSLPAGLFKTAKGDVWVAEQGGFVVRVSLGGTSDFGDLTWDYNITDVNVTAPVSLPEKCLTVKSTDLDIPLPKSATNVSKGGGNISFTSTDAPNVIADFFKLSLPPKGWTLQMQTGSGGATIQLFVDSTEKQMLQVMIQPDGSSGSNVNIMQIQQ